MGAEMLQAANACAAPGEKVQGQWIIYGLGLNLNDDGGNIEKLEDGGLGPAKK
jgi:hypothetical protein